MVSRNDFEYATDSGCLSVKVHIKDKEEEERSKSENCQLPYIGIAELRQHGRLAQSLLAELVGTLVLVFIGCGSCMAGDQDELSTQLDDQANIVRISLCFGLTVAALAQTLGHVSGCHVNPAVSLGLVVGAKVGVVKGLLYVVAQCTGGLAGAALLSAVVSEEIRGRVGLGQTSLGSQVTAGQAVVVEMVITAVLVMVVLAAACDQLNTPNVKGSPPLAIGLTVTACHLFAVPLTGASMNPARSLGPAAVISQWEQHWVYWAGPLLGGLVGGLVYQLLFRGRAPRPVETRHCSPPYQPHPVVSPHSESPSRARELVYVEQP